MEDRRFKYFLHSKNKPEDSVLASAGAVIKNKSGEYLFEIKPKTHKNNPGGLALFGGMRDGSETEEICLKRELFEELKLDIDKQGCILKHLGYAQSASKVNTYHARYLIEDVDDSNFTLSEESAGIFKTKDLNKIKDCGNLIKPSGLIFIINALESINKNKKNFDRWNNVKKETVYHSLKLFREREIWWSEFGHNVGFEQNGKGGRFMRPVLVLQRHNWHTALVLPMTSRDKSESKFHVPLGYDDKVSYVSLSQARVISGKRFVRRIRKIRSNQFDIVLDKFIKHIKTRRP